MVPREGLRILNASHPSDRSLWLGAIADWADHEVYCHPDYVSLFVPTHAKGLAALWEGGAGGILYPFILQPLSLEPWYQGDQHCDLISPYGYGGPFRWGNPSSVEVNIFWGEFEDWLAKAHVVSSFVRLSLFEDQIVGFNGRVKTVAPNVIRDLRGSSEEMWMDYAHKVRKNVKRARTSGVTVRQVRSRSDLSSFIQVYESTLNRRSARAWYHFPEGFYDRLVTNLRDYVAIFSAFHEDEVVASEIVLVSRKRIYSFLGGTTLAGFQLRANDLLKHEIIVWARDEGKESFVLGGGFEPDDGILRYKRGFAPEGEVPFRVGMSTHDANAYSRLVMMRASWEARRGGRWHPDDQFFPAYRQP